MSMPAWRKAAPSPVPLHRADHGAAQLDCEDAPVALLDVGGQLPLREEAPPALDGWFPANQFERRDVSRHGRTHEDPIATQRNH